MKTILAACTAILLSSAAFAAGPGATPSTDMTPSTATTPASMTPAQSCADMISRARTMTMPSDATKAKSVSDELAAADAAGDDATCKTHASNALTLLGGS